MAPSIVVFPTAGWNSYTSLASADAYLENQLHATAWRAASADDKTRALITMTAWLERLRWKGEKTVSSQEGTWPRATVVDQDGNTLDSATIPEFLQEAEWEGAAALLADLSVLTSSQGSVKKITDGDVAIEWGAPLGGKPSKFPKIVKQLITFFLRAQATSAAGAVFGQAVDEDGTIVDSDYVDPDLWNRTDPLG